MGHTLQNFQLAAPAFYGLNTEDSPINQQPQFCQVADNAVIDSYGRIGARRAFTNDTDVWPTLSGRATIDGTGTVVSSTGILDHIQVGDINGTKHILCLAREEGYNAAGVFVTADYYILKRNGNTLTELTLPAVADKSTFPTGQIVAFNNKMYILSEGNEIIVYDGTALSNISSEAGYYPIHAISDYRPGATPTVTEQAPTPTVGLAAFGRLWVTGHEGDFQRVWYSDLNIAQSWYDDAGTDSLSTAGYIDVSQYWPAGGDNIVGLAAHNNFLIMFGRQSVLVWGNPSGDPAAADGIFLSDTIRNIGCVSRDAVLNIGTDVLFLDDTGVRSLGRALTQENAPISDLTRNIRRNLTSLIASTVNNSTIKAVYVPDLNFCLFYFPENAEGFCLDMKSYMSEGIVKVTRWTNIVFNHACYVEDASSVDLYFASNNENGVLKYSGFSEYDKQPYEFKYRSNPLWFDTPSRKKFPKVLKFTSITQNNTGTGVARWGFDARVPTYSKHFTIEAQQPAFFNVSEFSEDEYADGPEKIAINRVNTAGSGETVVLGLDMNINGNSFSLQEINLQSLIGRLR